MATQQQHHARQAAQQAAQATAQAAQQQAQQLYIMKENIDHAIHDLVKLKKEIILLELPNKKESNKAWDKLMVLSEKITKLWKGAGAVEEIREQREKK